MRRGVVNGRPEQPDVPLLDDVAVAADRVRELEREQREAMDAARAELRSRVRIAHDEGIPFSVIARRVGYSREWIRKLYEG
jgi:hypothetical protein